MDSFVVVVIIVVVELVVSLTVLGGGGWRTQLCSGIIVGGGALSGYVESVAAAAVLSVYSLARNHCVRVPEKRSVCRVDERRGSNVVVVFST